MTSVIISDILPRTQAIATGGQTVYSTDWTADVASDVVVYSRAAGVDADDATQILSSSLYNVAFIGAGEIVQVTLINASTAGDIVTITRMTPADRLNLYTNTNFTPSMLNNDFGILTLVDQQAQLVNQQVAPRYNYSALIDNIVDTILPILGANETWVKNSSNTAFIPYELPTSGIAPADATFVTLTDETSTLPNSLALSGIGTGILINDASGNTLLTRTFTGTANQITITNGTGLAGNINAAIASNAVIPGTAGMGIPSGTTAQRVVPTPPSIGLRINTDLQSLEYYAGGTWNSISDNTDGIVLPGLANQLAYYASSGSTVSGLTTAASGVLTTVAGVPTWASLLSLALGGTNANLIASNGGIFYSTATAGAILSGTATDRQMLQSGVSSAPAWSTTTWPATSTINQILYSSSTNTVVGLATANNGLLITSSAGVPSILAGPGTSGQILQSNAATAPSFSTASYPSTTTVNQLLYSSSANTIVGLATANSAVLITSAGGVPSLSQTLPSAVQTNITALGIQAQALNMGGFQINNGASPTLGTDFATKNYVDQTALNGTAVYAATNTNLNVTQAGAGVGATLTDASGTFAVFSVDGVSPPLGSQILVKDLSIPASHQGVYTLTTNGDGISIPYVLTRSTSYDTPTEINNTGLIAVRMGTVWAGTAWYNSATIITVDTTNFVYTQFGNIVFPIALVNGGTGASLTASNGGIFYSNATTGAILAGTATAGQHLQSGANSAPSWTTATFPATATGTGTILRANGTNWVASTTTFPDTVAVNSLLSANSANTMSALAPALNGVLVSNNTSTGQPVWLAGPGTAGSTLLSQAAAAPIWSTGKPITQVVTQVFVANGTYTPTSGMTYCISECIAGGGAGGGATSGATTGGGGGGGGAGSYSRKVSTAAAIGASQTVTIGAGGTAGTAGNNPGNNGGDTSLGSICIAKGGTGGTGTPGGNAAGGGAGGIAGTGDVTSVGCIGWDGLGGTITTFSSQGGHGGSSPFGSGGRGIATNAAAAIAGGNAGNYGSGGGGGISNNNSGAVAGGTGSAGIIIITEFISV